MSAVLSSPVMSTFDIEEVYKRKFQFAKTRVPNDSFFYQARKALNLQTDEEAKAFLKKRWIQDANEEYSNKPDTEENAKLKEVRISQIEKFFNGKRLSEWRNVNAELSFNSTSRKETKLGDKKTIFKNERRGSQ